MEIIHLLANTVALRPYVFIFFAIYLFIAITSVGLKRTSLFTAIAYITAFVCEYSSTHFASGIPFGVYHYVEATRGKELWIAGVPFMDSLSFTFLSFISFRIALLLIGPRNDQTAAGPQSSIASITRSRGMVSTAALSGFLMMYLDIIIDPVTLQGKRWFLGELYVYPDHGSYFGVTLANFLGWFVVGLLIVVLFSFCERRLGSMSQPAGVLNYRFQDAAPVLLYFGILGFNLFVTFHIGETSMGLAGLFITMPLLMLVIFTVRGHRLHAGVLRETALSALEESAIPEPADLFERMG